LPIKGQQSVRNYTRILTAIALSVPKSFRFDGTLVDCAARLREGRICAISIVQARQL
jgi:hypothetical protein